MREHKDHVRDCRCRPYRRERQADQGLGTADALTGGGSALDESPDNACKTDWQGKRPHNHPEGAAEPAHDGSSAENDGQSCSAASHIISTCHAPIKAAQVNGSTAAPTIGSPILNGPRNHRASAGTAQGSASSGDRSGPVQSGWHHRRAQPTLLPLRCSAWTPLE